MTDGRPYVADWYTRIKARPSFTDAIVKWENPDYLKLMRGNGDQSWPKVQEVMHSLRAEETRSAA